MTTEKSDFRVTKLYGLTLGNVKSELDKNLSSMLGSRRLKNQQRRTDVRCFEIEIENPRETESLVKRNE